jgi:FkbM family methyltransferase
MVTSTLKRLVDRGTSRLGFRLIPAWRLPSLEHARDLAHLFTQLGIDTVLDVGAHEGGYRRFLRQHVGYTGRIISFEPVPAVFRRLVDSAAGDTAWRGIQAALGDIDGELVINVCDKTTMSSFLPRDTARLAGLGYRHLLRVTDVVRTEPVTVRRLDSVVVGLLDGRDEARVFLKCDTQGFDMRVMAGAARSLGSIVALQLELSFKPIYAGAPACGEVLEQMTGAGFDVSGIYPVRRDELLRIVNFDCVMVNSAHRLVADMAAAAVIGKDPAVA